MIIRAGRGGHRIIAWRRRKDWTCSSFSSIAERKSRYFSRSNQFHHHQRHSTRFEPSEILLSFPFVFSVAHLLVALFLSLSLRRQPIQYDESLPLRKDRRRNSLLLTTRSSSARHLLDHCKWQQPRPPSKIKPFDVPERRMNLDERSSVLQLLLSTGAQRERERERERDRPWRRNVPITRC